MTVSSNLAPPSPSLLRSSLAIDLGNTRTKVALFEDNTLVHQGSFLTHDESQYHHLVPWLEKEFTCLNEISHLALSSVVPTWDSYWYRAAQSLDKPLFHLSCTTAMTKIIFDLDTPDKVGADRIAGLLGAQVLYPGEHLVIVDMGTAITLNLLTNTGHYLGGAILSGLQTSLRHLTKATALLPTISLIPSALKIGKNTHDQLQLIVPFYKAGLKELIQELALQAFGNNTLYRVIGTGGDAPLLKEAHVFDVIEPDLKLLGVHQAFLAPQPVEAGSMSFVDLKQGDA